MLCNDRIDKEDGKVLAETYTKQHRCRIEALMLRNSAGSRLDPLWTQTSQLPSKAVNHSFRAENVTLFPPSSRSHISLTVEVQTAPLYFQATFLLQNFEYIMIWSYYHSTSLLPGTKMSHVSRWPIFWGKGTFPHKM